LFYTCELWPERRQTLHLLSDNRVVVAVMLDSLPRRMLGCLL